SSSCRSRSAEGAGRPPTASPASVVVPRSSFTRRGLKALGLRNSADCLGEKLVFDADPFLTVIIRRSFSTSCVSAFSQFAVSPARLAPKLGRRHLRPAAGRATLLTQHPSSPSKEAVSPGA